MLTHDRQVGFLLQNVGDPTSDDLVVIEKKDRDRGVIDLVPHVVGSCIAFSIHVVIVVTARSEDLCLCRDLASWITFGSENRRKE